MTDRFKARESTPAVPITPKATSGGNTQTVVDFYVFDLLNAHRVVWHQVGRPTPRGPGFRFRFLRARVLEVAAALNADWAWRSSRKRCKGCGVSIDDWGEACQTCNGRHHSRAVRAYEAELLEKARA